MNKWKLKGCPRCNGDLMAEWIEYNWYESCLQCGYQQELKNITELQKQENKVGK